MVPSFFAPILILANCDGRTPAIVSSVARSRNTFTGLPPLPWKDGHLRSAPRSAGNLLPKPPPMYSIRREHCRQELQAPGRVRRRWSRRPESMASGYFVTLPLDYSAMWLETAVRDDRNAISTFRCHLGLFEAGLGITGDLLARRFRTGADFREIALADDVR